MDVPNVPRRRRALVGRIAAGVLSGLSLAVFAWLAVVVVRSRFGASSAGPNGYAIIFGSMLSLPFLALGVFLAPVALPRRRRSGAYRIALPLGLLLALGMLTLWFTA